jgi:iron(III) transport system substrate-binding protein
MSLRKRKNIFETKSREVTLYTDRYYDKDQMIFENFKKSTGIKVNVVNASADELILKMESEGEQSPADLFITVIAGRVVRAKEKGLLQSVNSEIIETTVPANLRDEDNNWFGLTKRASIISYSKDRVNQDQLSTYKDLADPKWEKIYLLIPKFATI